MNKVLITGGTGFIGSHIVEYFCGKNISISCLMREKYSDANIKNNKIDIVYGDITDYKSLEDGFEGFDFIIHNAAYARDWGAYDLFYNTNVIGTLNVLNACNKNGIKNVIMTGSNSIYGEENSNIVKDENSPHMSHYNYFADKLLHSKLNYYRDTKRLAVDKAIEFAESKLINLTILNPVWVYGEREFNTGFYEYLKTAKSKIPFLPGSRQNKFHVIYVKDLARAYYLAFESKLDGVNSIIIGNRERDLMDRIYTLFCIEAGCRKPKNIPKCMIYPVAFVLEVMYTIFNTKNPPLLTRGRVNMFYDNIEYNTKKAEQLIGFISEYTIEEGIKKTVKWYKEMNLL